MDPASPYFLLRLGGGSDPSSRRLHAAAPPTACYPPGVAQAIAGGDAGGLYDAPSPALCGARANASAAPPAQGLLGAAANGTGGMLVRGLPLRLPEAGVYGLCYRSAAGRWLALEAPVVVRGPQVWGRARPRVVCGMPEGWRRATDRVRGHGAQVAAAAGSQVPGVTAKKRPTEVD